MLPANCRTRQLNSDTASTPDSALSKFGSLPRLHRCHPDKTSVSDRASSRAATSSSEGGRVAE